MAVSYREYVQEVRLEFQYIVRGKFYSVHRNQLPTRLTWNASRFRLAGNASSTGVSSVADRKEQTANSRFLAQPISHTVLARRHPYHTNADNVPASLAGKSCILCTCPDDCADLDGA